MTNCVVLCSEDGTAEGFILRLPVHGLVLFAKVALYSNQTRHRRFVPAFSVGEIGERTRCCV